MSTFESFVIDDGTIMNNFQKMLKEIPDRVEEMVDAVTSDTFDASQQDVAVLTGDLRDSGVASTGWKTKNKYMGVIEYGTDHCWYVELGTYKMAEQPYLYPNFLIGAQELSDKALEIMGSF